MDYLLENEEGNKRIMDTQTGAVQDCGADAVLICSSNDKTSRSFHIWYWAHLLGTVTCANSADQLLKEPNGQWT